MEKLAKGKKTNAIKKLKDEDGVWWLGQEKVEGVLIDFFADLFTTSNPTGMDESCEAVQHKLTEDQNEWCTRPYSMEEIKEAIDQMHPLKAPGPDGIQPCFTKNTGISWEGTYVKKF